MPVRSRWLQRRSLATYAFVMNGKALRFALGLLGRSYAIQERGAEALL
jgi:hypothetical protein